VVVGELISPGSGASVLLVSATVVVTLAAVLVRSERARLDAIREGAASQERLRIARDLHDLIGHGLGIVAIQSSTARMALDSGDTATARNAISAVESSSRSALREMREQLGVLRGVGDAETAEDEEGDASRPPAPGLADIASLVDNVRLGGVAVTSETEGDFTDVPAAVQLCAYRVVQESLTNAIKHADPTRVTVTLSFGDAGLEVEVIDDGVRAAQEVADHHGGHGIVGMRERAHLLGGSLDAQPRPGGGFRLTAHLPVKGEPS
jgi:signal transduction histidine kinase